MHSPSTNTAKGDRRQLTRQVHFFFCIAKSGLGQIFVQTGSLLAHFQQDPQSKIGQNLEPPTPLLVVRSTYGMNSNLSLSSPQGEKTSARIIAVAAISAGVFISVLLVVMVIGILIGVLTQCSPTFPVELNSVLWLILLKLFNSTCLKSLPESVLYVQYAVTLLTYVVSPVVHAHQPSQSSYTGSPTQSIQQYSLTNLL